VAPGMTLPSSFQAIVGLLPAGTMCRNEKLCVLGTLSVRLVLAGDVDTIVSTTELVTLVMPSWQTRHSATPRLRIRQLFFGR
jgi:hypothetical protein